MSAHTAIKMQEEDTIYLNRLMEAKEIVLYARQQTLRRLDRMFVTRLARRLLHAINLFFPARALIVKLRWAVVDDAAVRRRDRKKKTAS